MSAEEVHEAEVVDETPGTELAPVQATQVAARVVAGATPEQVMGNAGVIASALKKVIDGQGLAKNVGGNRKHVEVGGWQAAGAMLGALGGEALHAETVWTRRVLNPDGTPERTVYTQNVKRYFPKNQGGGIREEVTAEVDGFSWEARVEVKTAAGVVVGSAEAMCSRSENTWAARDDFALRSMAETRAESRAFRRAIGWIINMAGYSATPAEEMGHDATALPPNGPAAPDALAAGARSALVTVLGDKVGPQCLAHITAACGGYLPAAVAGALAEFGTAYAHVHPAPTDIAA